VSVHNYVQKSEKQGIGAQLRAARAGLSPWELTPADRLATIGRLCGEDEIAEAIAILDDLSAERAALPAWDGDGSDDIAQAQESYVAILGHVPPDCLLSVAAGLASASPDTRRWLTLALEALGPAALPALRAACDAEPDTNTRQFMTEAVGRLEATVRAP
jgi:hypothetical protein